MTAGWITQTMCLCFLLSIILYLSISSAYLQLQKRHTVPLKLLIFCSVLSNTGFSSLTCVTMIYLLHYLKHHVLLISLLSSNISMTTRQNKTHTFVLHIKWLLPFFFKSSSEEVNTGCSVPVAVARLTSDTLILLSQNELLISHSLYTLCCTYY